MRVLVLNAGSSSLKGALWELGDGPPPSVAPGPPLWEARVDWGRHPGFADIRAGHDAERRVPIGAPGDAFASVLETLPEGGADVVGHRIVHGGAKFRESVRITPEVRDALAQLAEFAPEHNAIEVAAIDAVTLKLGVQVPQVAVFDTAFHATLPEPAYVYPGPIGWLDRGIRRYGFHGISYQYTSRRTAEILGRELESLRMVICHLGNGCSACAIAGGRSIDTTMGFTPLEGLMMGTRSGSIDPGICVYLIRHCGYTADDLDRVLNKESGLKGISGISADMREILAARDAGDARAKLAFDMFAHRLCRETGGMVASLGGAEVLVFTGGIGENCAPLRDVVEARLGFLGMQVLVVPTDEDWEIARNAQALGIV